MDGKIVIGTELDNKDLEKGLRKSEAELRKYASEKERLLTQREKAELDLSSYYEAVRLIKEATDETLRISNNPLEVDAAMKSEERLIGRKNEQYKKELDNLGLINNKIQENATKQETVKRKIVEINEELRRQQGIEGAKQYFANMGNSIEGIAVKLRRWALSLFSVASMYMLVRRASSTAMQQNQELANSMAGVWNYLAELIMPIMEVIVSWIMKAISAINYFFKILTGVDFAAKANERTTKRQTKATERQTKAVKKQAQAQKELNKELAAFDEINKVTDEQNKGNDLDDAGSVGGGVPDVSVPEGLLKLPELSEKTKKVLEGLANIIKKIVDFAKEHPKVLATLLGGAAITSLIAKILGVSSVATPLGLLGVLAVLTAINFVVYDQIKKEFAELNKSIEETRKTLKGNTDGWKEYGEEIKKTGISSDAFDKTIKSNIKSLGNSTLAMAESRTKIGEFDFAVQVLSGTYQENRKVLEENINTLNAEADAMFVAYNQTDKNSESTENMTEYLKKYKSTLEKTNEQLGSNYNTSVAYSDVIKDNKEKIKDVDLRLQYLDYTLQGGKKSFEDYKKSVENTNKKLDDTKNKTNALNGKKATIKIDADTSSADRKTKNWFKNFINSAAINPINSILSNFGLKIPKLAKGGIINMPGQGVPLAGAIGGERGAEGVIPLTDSQQMDLLGAAIGKHITVAPTIPVYVGNRQIARVVKEIEEEDSFAYNR